MYIDERKEAETPTTGNILVDDLSRIELVATEDRIVTVEEDGEKTYLRTKVGWKPDPAFPMRYLVGTMVKCYESLVGRGYEPMDIPRLPFGIYMGRRGNAVFHEMDQHFELMCRSIGAFDIFQRLWIHTPYATFELDGPTDDPTERYDAPPDKPWSAKTGTLAVISHLPLPAHLSRLITYTSSAQGDEDVLEAYLGKLTFGPSSQVH